MCGELNLLRVGTLTGDQIAVHRAQPIICHDGFSCHRELIRPEPKESCQPVHLRRWWLLLVVLVILLILVVLVVHKLSHHGHQLSLSSHHLLHHGFSVVVVALVVVVVVVVVVVAGVTTGRHLWFYEVDEQQMERSKRYISYPCTLFKTTQQT